MMFELFFRYFHTVRYLKLEQVIGRIYRHVKKIELSPPLTIETRKLRQPFLRIHLNKRSIFDHDQFVVLNETGSIYDWHNKQRSHLWLYNLHYFNDLNSLDADNRVEKHTELVNRWIDENSPGIGIGWEAYPTSLRIVNWIKWLLVHCNATEKQLFSLALQAKVLNQKLEFHLLGNHIFSNAKALLFAGLYFKGPEADQWLACALKLFAREIPEQVLEDGGHFELTPMYHATIISDLLDILTILNAYQDNRTLWLEKECKKRLIQMIRWLAVMTHPDGDVSFFNDASTDIAPTLAQLVHIVKVLDIAKPSLPQDTFTHLEASGYFRINLEDAVLIGDVGRVGPDYIPGHAHADTLSFELSIFDQRLIVNSGTSLYGSSAERVRQRGTEAHSTVVINEENSSEVWGGFRVARRAKPFDIFIDKISRTVKCSHDGYKRLRGKPIHTRQWHYGQRSLTISDTITGQCKSAEARFHLHPAWMSQLDGNVLLCQFHDKVAKLVVKTGFARLEDSTYHPEFGSQIGNKVFVVVLNDRFAEIEILW